MFYSQNNGPINDFFLEKLFITGAMAKIIAVIMRTSSTVWIIDVRTLFAMKQETMYFAQERTGASLKIGCVMVMTTVVISLTKQTVSNIHLLRILSYKY